MKPRIALSWALLAVFALPVFAENAALQQGREALTDRHYEEAARLLAQAAAPGQERADEAQLLLGQALLRAKKYNEAIAAYDRLLRDFPQSAWRKKALFQKADAYGALKQWDKAAALYEPELDNIVSDERKEQVAEIYLKYAAQYFEPPKNAKGETPAPNYAKAKALFQKALDIGLTPKKTEDVLLRVALSDFHANNWGGAIETLRVLLTRFPQGAQVEEAKYYLGLANLRSGNDREARKIFRDFLRDYPNAKRRGDVSLTLAQTYHVPEPRDTKELQAGVQALRDFVRLFPGHPKALQAGYWIGLSLFNQARYEDAVKEFGAFITANAKADADEVAQAQNYLGLALLRQKKYDSAITAWDAFLREHPVHRLWQSVQRQVLDAQYAIGDEAYTAKKYDAARLAWQAFQDKYPLDVRNADIMFRLGMMLLEAKQYDAAIEQWKKVASKYGGTEAASRAQFMTAMTYETLGRFEDAMTAHRLVTGKWQNDAQARLAELKNRKLLVYTERTFSTADAPALKLVTRNVPSVQLRAYKVDMNDYFRKLHTMRGVEALDLALIEPDWRWELKLPDYQEFRQSEAQAPLPFKEPGVYAVVCSAPLADEKDKTDGQNAPALEATNIVLITDLGLVTKTTHNDMLVFAENLRTRAPWPNAQILLTDGRRIVANGTTNADGVFQWKNEAKAALTTVATEGAPLRSDVRVLAQSIGHFASTEGDLRGVVRLTGLQPTGAVYSDRPLYRAGQPVYFRAIVRQVENGQYAFKKGEEYQVSVTDAGGAVIYSRRLALGDFGTLSGSVLLGGEAPPGRYTISVTRPRLRDTGPDDPQIVPVAGAEPRPDTAATPRVQPFSAMGTFQVAVYRLEKVRLTIELPKTVYLRGEEIKGKVIAKYLHGEPLARRKIRFGWNREIGVERETDAKGEFEFTIPTRPFEEDEAVAVWARLEEENAAVQRVAFVATVGVRPVLSMLRDVHLSGEKFDVTIEIKDLADKPFVGEFKLAALKLEKDEAGRLGEREVQSVPVKTGADGKATASFTLGEAGEYILRLSGQDGNDNPVSSDLATQIVGNEDKVRLRILSDTDSYKVGETAKVRVIWRGPEKVEDQTTPPDADAPKLALVTYEGDRVYGYQLVTLQKSDDNQITVPLTLPLAPVFRFSIALMDGNQFHEAAKWFRVTHELKVKIKTDAAQYRPGGKVKATLEVTDQNGKPVAAELSLAAVDQALLAAAGGDANTLAALIETRAAREGAIQTGTSATFHYAAEARRRVLQVKEAETLTRTMLAGVDAGATLPPNHWVYGTLDRLAQNGLVERLNEGTYAGNKAMTRYEAAVQVARALQNGDVGQLASNLGRQRANADLNTAQNEQLNLLQALQTEFAPELSQLSANIYDPNIYDRRAKVTGYIDLAGTTTNAPRLVYRRTGTGSVGGVANLFGYGGQENPLAEGGARGATGPQGPAGPQGSSAPLQRILREAADGTILTHWDKSERSPQSQTATGLLFDPKGKADEQALGLPEGADKVADIAVANGLLVQGTAGEAQLQEQLAFLEAPQREQLIANLRRRFAETAFWSASVVTDEAGHASVEFTLPDSLTEWHLAAAGVTRDTLVGQATQDITSSKPFLVEIKAPALLQEGDRAKIAAVVHNNGDKPVTAQVTLRVRLGATEKAVPQSVAVEANATREIALEVDVPDVREAKIVASASGGGQTDSAELSVPVRPWGIEYLATAGGVAEGSRSVEVKLPAAKYDGYRLKLTVGPNASAALLDIAANPGGEGWRQPLTSSTAHRALGLVQGIGYLRAQNRGNDALHARLSGDLETHLARLVKAQKADGSWSWTLPAAKQNRECPSDLLMTADATNALAQAKQLGFAVPPATLQKALEFLQARYGATGEGGNDQKALILYTQSVAKAAEFAPLNRLYRLRNSLDARSLAYLALALQHADRAPEAQEIVRLLEERIPKDALGKPSPGPSRGEGSSASSPTGGGRVGANALDLRATDDVALVALAVARITPKNLLLNDLAALLWARRSGNGWATPRATALALSALVQQAFATKIAPEKYTLRVAVGGQEIKTFNVDGNAATANFEVPAALLGGPAARVNFTLAGKGSYTYAAQLYGFTTEGILDDATRDKLERDGKEWRGASTGPLVIQRSYTQAPLLFDGKPVPRGFDTVSTEETWENKANEVPVGQRVQVHLTWWTPNDTWLGDRRGNYIVVREPLPAGCRVDETSIAGQFERYEIEDGAITFFFYELRDPGVSYDLYGVRDGSYRVLPTKIWAAERPGLYAYGTFKNLAVLPRGAAVKDVYRLTPDELYHLGKAHFARAQAAIANGQTPDAADFKTAEAHLLALFNKDADPKGWKLHDDPAKDTVRTLFEIALHRADAQNTVRFFEVLRERFPQEVVPFRQIVQTARAYGQMGEREREVQVMRATAEASFGREAQIAAALEDEGEYAASFGFVAERAREYPDVANVDSALYTLAQAVAQRAEEERKKGNKASDKELGKLAAGMLRDFLAFSADNPAGDEASFAYAVNLVEQEKFDEAAAWCARSRARYENSAYADDLTYIATYANYLGEKFDAALQMAQELATKEYPQPDGTKARSAYRSFAIYIAAQIFHTRGNAAKAVEFYRQVGEQFPDARESAAYFMAKELKMPEVVAVAPGEPAKLKIAARNVREAQLSVYKVDLLKFYQNRRNLLDLGAMNLAGIKPVWESTVDLGAEEFVNKTKTVELPLPEKGAYFVALKADDGQTRLAASGVVVRSELELEVQEDATSGRVRVNVARHAPEGQSGALQPKAEVWVIGSANDTFRKGATDLRGVVTAADVRGKPTIIVYKDGDYAFYRSEKILQPQYATIATPSVTALVTSDKPAEAAKSFKDQARDVYLGNNADVQKKQAENYRGLQGRGANNAQGANAGGAGGFGGRAGSGGVAAGQAF